MGKFKMLKDWESIFVKEWGEKNRLWIECQKTWAAAHKRAAKQIEFYVSVGAMKTRLETIGIYPIYPKRRMERLEKEKAWEQERLLASKKEKNPLSERQDPIPGVDALTQLKMDILWAALRDMAEQLRIPFPGKFKNDQVKGLFDPSWEKKLFDHGKESDIFF